MLVRHRIVIRSKCPVDGADDTYVCDTYPTSLLKCEDVRDAVAELTAGPVFQEMLTAQLAERLGCKVRTRGTHCRGRVETVVVCLPPPSRRPT